MSLELAQAILHWTHGAQRLRFHVLTIDEAASLLVTGRADEPKLPELRPLHVAAGEALVRATSPLASRRRAGLTLVGRFGRLARRFGPGRDNFVPAALAHKPHAESRVGVAVESVRYEYPSQTLA